MFKFPDLLELFTLKKIFFKAGHVVSSLQSRVAGARDLVRVPLGACSET